MNCIEKEKEGIQFIDFILKTVYKNICFWVRKRNVSLRRFFYTPKTYVLCL